MSQRKAAKYDQSKITDESTLINGLVAIGNLGGQESSKLDELNRSLTNAHYDLRKSCLKLNKTQSDYNERARTLLETHAPNFQDACEEAGLMDTNLSTHWRSKAKGIDKNITAAQLFEKISDLPPTTAQAEQENVQENAPEVV